MNYMNEVKEEEECSLAKRKCTKTHAKRWNVSSFEGNPSKKQNGNFSTGIAIVR